jgi:hypothetical protein
MTVNSVTSPYTITGLTSCTGYSVQVQAVCGSTVTSPYSTTVSFTTSGCSGGGPAPLNYCSSYSLNSASEYIQYFSVSNLSNNSGNNNGFGNFINMTANLVNGRSETLTFQPGFSGTAMTEYWIVLIDFNRNGSFADAGEKVAQVTGSGSGPVSANFTTPLNASTGGARMRVQMKRAAYATECDIYSYGEVEDYLVNISTVAPRLSASTDYDRLLVYPNPAGEQISISFEAASTRDISILDLNGRILQSLKSETDFVQMDLRQLTAGTYLLQVEDPSGTRRALFIRK